MVWVVLVRGMATLHACKYGKYICGQFPGAHGAKLASSIVSIRIVTLIKYRSKIDSKESTEEVSTASKQCAHGHNSKVQG